MIKFNLRCDHDHTFEGWFASSDAFDTQAKRGFVSCPDCGSSAVRKALMAPSVSTTRDRAAVAAEVAGKQREIMSQLRKIRDTVTSQAENVGDRFAQEARRIHYSEVPKKAVYGSASKEEVTALAEEGIAVAPLPRLPEDAN